MFNVQFNNFRSRISAPLQSVDETRSLSCATLSLWSLFGKLWRCQNQYLSMIVIKSVSSFIGGRSRSGAATHIPQMGRLLDLKTGQLLKPWINHFDEMWLICASYFALHLRLSDFWHQIGDLVIRPPVHRPSWSVASSKSSLDSLGLFDLHFRGTFLTFRIWSSCQNTSWMFSPSASTTRARTSWCQKIEFESEQRNARQNEESSDVSWHRAESFPFRRNLLTLICAPCWMRSSDSGLRCF